jgi:hypothetical protein
VAITVCSPTTPSRGLELETGHDAVAGPPGRLAGSGGEVPFGLEEVERSRRDTVVLSDR